MIHAFHSIFGVYGFWLPNDPRGSGSDYIASWELFRYGPATKTDSRRSVAAAPHNHSQRVQAKQALKYPPARLSEIQVATAVEGFAEASRQSKYRIHACAVMPDHVHLVIDRHDRDIRRLVGHLKGSATLALKNAGLWPNDGRPLWGEHGWNVFLDSETAVRRAIRYVEENPLKEGLPRQNWSLVTPFLPGRI